MNKAVGDRRAGADRAAGAAADDHSEDSMSNGRRRSPAWQDRVNVTSAVRDPISDDRPAGHRVTTQMSIIP